MGAEASCADADVQPTPQNVARVSDVIFCLMNAMRANAGLPPLQEQDELAQASVEHSQDMVDHEYFAHDSQDGRDLVARLKAVAYIPTSGQWVVGENLAWGSGTLATPSALVNAWMNSPGHRENLLAGDYREVGMGVVFGTPRSDVPDGVTVTTDFWMRPGTAAAAPRSSGASA
ncbi:MAG TPA: CAP domain-containing protein, partial [Thermoleophilaceae bacterium]|nr:CAP domain-containing protein [Thermoleophilaceae bacterium]